MTTTASMLNLDELSKNLQRVGLQVRDEQFDMIKACFGAIDSDQIIGVEAPTGTGKTLAYVLGTLPAKQSDQTIIISTATIALQEQLIQKDLPLVEKILKTKLVAALAKGRRRYVCHARVYDQSWQDDLLTNDEDVSAKLQLSLEQDQWSGDYDELSFPVDSEQWRRFSTDSDGCAGKSCEYFEDCAFFKARKKMYVADVVVVNHSLLLSDMNMGGGVVLPGPEDSIYVIDECHHLPSKALDHFSHQASVMGVVDWVNTLNRFVNQARAYELFTETQQQLLLQLTKEMVTTSTQVRDLLALNDKQFDEGCWRIVTVPEGLQLLADDMKRVSDQIVNHVQAAVDAAMAKLGGTTIDAEQRQELARINAGLSVALSRARNQYLTWRLFCHKREPKEAPVAKWFTQSDNGYSCHVAPIYIGDVLQTQLWDRCKNGAVLCSATMSALGSLDYFSRRAGLKQYGRYTARQLPSHFDFSHSLLYVPAMQHEPVGALMAKHEREVLALLPELIAETGGTLVLFTSRRAMLATYDALPAELAQDVIVQKGQSKSKLVALHKKRIRNWQRSILFGLASFGEGLDLPADFCRHVIIHKLPFTVPSTPTELTRSEWLKSNRLNPFMMSTLPQASMQLTQYVGRLIRQDSDRGVVTVLDKRLYSKPYGAQLLKNLPAFTNLINGSIIDFKARFEALGLDRA